jgi:DNA-binding CsgD family transcriptional regulator
MLCVGGIFGQAVIRRNPTSVAVGVESRFSDICRRYVVNEMNGGRLQLPLAVLLLVIAAGGAVDLVLDRPTRWFTVHTVYEVGMVLFAAGTAAWLWRGWRRAEAEGDALRRNLAAHQVELDAWQASEQQAIEGFANAMARQFDTWALTPAEREIALQLLKGRSHKEIAAATGRSERTVRQHAAAAYQKAGLDGRAALAAFFLEGLMLPARGIRTERELAP